jgi:trk system potassium uptake protein TrkA
MRVVILGCGRLGSTLAKNLSAAGHAVSVIDRSREAFRRLDTRFAGKMIVGLGIDEDVLIRAGIEKAEVFVAVTNGDNTNIMASQMAKARFRVPRVLTRIVDPVRAHVYHELGLDTFCTTTVAAGLIGEFVEGRPWDGLPESIKLHGDGSLLGE